MSTETPLQTFNPAEPIPGYRMLERVHLIVVREVESRGSLTAAADVLGLTQSALSHSIKKLEAQLGAPIWRREGRNLRLTQAGQHVLALANEVLPRVELAEERLRQFDCERTPRGSSGRQAN